MRTGEILDELAKLARKDEKLKEKFLESRKKKSPYGEFCKIANELGYDICIGDLIDAETLEDLRYVPGNYHELVENRKGQWACDLDQPYRLIFEPHENPIPTDKDGKYIWAEIKGIEVVEIEDYH